MVSRLCGDPSQFSRNSSPIKFIWIKNSTPDTFKGENSLNYWLFWFFKNVKIKVVIHISYFLGFSDPTFVLRMNMEIDVHILDDNHPIILLLILLQPCINGPANSCCWSKFRPSTLHKSSSTPSPSSFYIRNEGLAD